MKKNSSKIRESIARLQEQLKQAETREAERLGRLALKAGLGEFEIDEGDLQTAFADIVTRFQSTRQTAHNRQSTLSTKVPLKVGATSRSAEEA